MENQKLGFFKNRFVVILAALLMPAFTFGSPTPKIEVPMQPVVEGGVFFVTVHAPEKAKNVEAFFNDRVIEFYPDGKETFTGLVGVEIGAKEGKSEMLVKIRLDERETIQKKVEIEIKKGTFEKEDIVVEDKRVKPETEAQKRKITLDNAFLNKMYAQSVHEKLWNPPLAMPIESVITAPFGTSRLYKGRKNKKIQKTGFHRGTDLKAAMRTPIKAPLAGKVVASRYLYYTGNTVILDHGYGFFSIYGHMNSLSVKEKTVVAKGALLGLSGATGRAAGPHLHWGMKIHGALVNPMLVIELFKQKPQELANDAK
jgi:murein DD-endopeptidase MepM/ murein hydrolase activator NlpD